jgi:hypothetical protein
MKNIDDINYPVNLGEEYLVPCITIETFKLENIPLEVKSDEQCEWMDIDKDTNFQIKESKIIKNIPIINHLHSDKENGQKQSHYHVDFRFIGLNQLDDIQDGIFQTRYNEYYNIEYIPQKVVSEFELYPTPKSLIKNSKIKHKEAKNYKCPHRGYDLRKVKPKDGCITCPLHGLKFKENNMELIHE